MKINAIRLTNFRCFEDRTFTLGGRTFLAGLNGAGKSTIIDAISWGLRGVCRGTDARGAGSKELIRLGADQASVTLDIPGMGAITRTVQRNGGGGCTMKTDAILARLNATDAAVEAVLYGRAFFSLHHKEAKDLLLKILDVQIPASALPGVDLGGRPADLDTLDLLYKTAFDNRATTKKAVATVALPDVPPAPADADTVSLTAKAAAARTAERQAAAKLAAVTTELHGVVQAIQKVKPINVDELRGKRIAHEGMLLESLQSAKAAVDRVTDLTAEIGTSQAELGAKIQDRKTLILKVKAHDPERGCILNSLIPCQTEPKLFTAQIKALTAEVKSLEADVKRGEQTARGLAQASQTKTDADRAVTYHQGQIDAVDRALASADEIDEELSRLSSERIRLDAAVADAKAIQDAMILESSALADAAQAAVRYTTAVQGRQAAEDRRSRLQAEVDKAEAQVELLGPKGVRATALQAAVEDFETAINVGLDGFGFRLSFNVDPWKVEVSRDRGLTWLPFELLSKGEQLWTGACFQQALAAVTGLGFVAVDDTESVVGANRAMLTRLIMLSPVEQILVAMAKGEGDALPVIDGLTVIPVSTPDATA